MQIQALGGYYNRSNLQSSKVPSFNAGLSDRQYDVVLQRLKKVNSEVKPRFSGELLKETMNAIIDRYECLGVKSVAMQIISSKDLPEFLGAEALKYDLKDKIGICVAVGNKNAPIEDMTNIYDAVTLLATKDDLTKM